MLAWTEKKYKVKGTEARGIDTVLRHPRLDWQSSKEVDRSTRSVRAIDSPVSSDGIIYSLLEGYNITRTLAPKALGGMLVLNLDRTTPEFP